MDILLRKWGHLFPLICLILALLISGCGRSGGNGPEVSHSSVLDLMTILPNMKAFDVESCDYTVCKSTESSRVPSPSDTKIEVKGTAVLSEESSKRIRSQFDWKIIARTDLPKSILTILPNGDFLGSAKLNETFTDNPTYAHGFVIVLGDSSSRTLYFLATDMDHSIE